MFCCRSEGFFVFFKYFRCFVFVVIGVGVLFFRETVLFIIFVWVLGKKSKW